MHLHKVFFTMLFALSVITLGASAPTPAPSPIEPILPMEPLDLGEPMSMVMSCIDDYSSRFGMQRGALSNGRGMRRQMRQQAAAPAEQFDDLTFIRFVKEFKAKPLELFLKAQRPIMLKAHINKPYAAFYRCTNKMSALQYVTRYVKNDNDGCQMASILVRYGAQAIEFDAGALAPSKEQYSHSPLMIAKLRYRYAKDQGWLLTQLLVDGHSLSSFSPEHLAGLGEECNLLSDAPLTRAQLAGLKVGPEDQKYALYKLLELFSRVTEVDSLADDFAAISAPSACADPEDGRL